MRVHNRTTLSLTLLMITTITQWLPAQEPSVTQAPIANKTTIVVASIEPDKVEFPAWFTETTESDEFFGVADSLRSGVERLKSMSPKDTVFAAVDVPSGSIHAATRLLVREQKSDASQSLGGYSVTSLGPIEEFELPVGYHQSRGRFKQANQSLHGLPIRILVAPPKYLSDTFDELMPQLPELLGGGQTSVLTRGIQWASIGIDPSNLKVRAMISSAGHEDAKAIAEQLPQLLKGALELLPEPDRSTIKPLAEVFLKTMKAEVDGPYVRLSFPELGDNQSTRNLFAEVAQQLTGPVSRSSKTDKFRSIILAMLNYESANQMMPPRLEARDKDGKPGLSWRVHILPYFGEEGAALWKRFHLDEPWDSPHNKTLLTEMPDVYNPVSRFSNRPFVKPGYTTYVAPVGEGTVFGQSKPTRISNIQDGLSKTVAVLEVTPEHAVPWTAPQDYKFDTDAPARDIAWDRDDITLGGFCDGHIGRLDRKIPNEMWLRLFQMNDGKPIKLP